MFYSLHFFCSTPTTTPTAALNNSSCNPKVDIVNAMSSNPFTGGSYGAGVDNTFPNPSFSNVENEGTLDVEGWILSGAQARTTEPQVGISERVPGFRVLTITVASGGTATLAPSPAYWQAKPPGGSFSAASAAGCGFGVFVNTNQPAGYVVATMKALSGSMVSSAAHVADGRWRFVGMLSSFDPTNGPLPKFYFQNTQGTVPLVVHVTAPSFSFGHTAPSVGSAAGGGTGGYLALVASGGIAGRAASVGPSSLNSAANSELTLHRDANVFVLTLVTGSNIRRLNQQSASRFVPGTVITLLFEESGVTVYSSGYIRLAGATGLSWSSTVRASMTLLAEAAGTWREVSSQR